MENTKNGYSKEMLPYLEQRHLCMTELPSLIFRIIALDASDGLEPEYIKERCNYVRYLVDEALKSTEGFYYKMSGNEKKDNHPEK